MFVQFYSRMPKVETTILSYIKSHRSFPLTKWTYIILTGDDIAKLHGEWYDLMLEKRAKNDFLVMFMVEDGFFVYPHSDRAKKWRRENGLA